MFSFVLLFLTLVASQNYNTPLDNFVNAPDPVYSYIDTGGRYNGTNAGGAWTAYVLNMTSQMWLNSSYVNKPIWWHWVILIIPEDVKYTNFATVVGTGGNNKNYNNWPSLNEEYFEVSRYIATHTKTIIAVLYQIPNEPLVFSNDPSQTSRSEDAIIAWGWHIFSLYPYDSEYRYNWITHFAMAKAMVKTMDTIEDYVSKNFDLNITRWACAGASKRGLATWLTAAVDKRIEAFVPIVYDMPNLHTNLHHMWRAYGGWTWAFKDYYAVNLTAELDTEWFHQLCEASDPYYFFDRYANKMKLVIDATMDEFFMPDDEYYWWDDFPEPKYFETIPNAEHSEATGVQQLAPSIATFLTAFLSEMEFPIYDWVIDYNNNGTITASLTGNTSAITRVLMYYAKSCGSPSPRRDFRIASLDDPCPCGIINNGYCVNAEGFWRANELTKVSDNGIVAEYIANLDSIPSDHWEGFLIGLQYQFFEYENENSFDELLYKNSKPLKDDGFAGMFDSYGKAVFTTQVSIQPNTFPFPPCNGTACYGTLV